MNGMLIGAKKEETTKKGQQILPLMKSAERPNPYPWSHKIGGQLHEVDVVKLTHPLQIKVEGKPQTSIKLSRVNVYLAFRVILQI